MEALVELGQTGADSFSGGAVERQGGDLILSFARTYTATPENLHLSFAVGVSSDLGYHKARECFEVESLAVCGAPAPNTTAPDCPMCPVCGGTGSDAGTDITAMAVPMA